MHVPDYHLEKRTGGDVGLMNPFLNHLRTSHEVKMYYDLNNILTYNALINIIIGERGVGKTYGCKKFCIKDYLKNGNQFVYLRRYATELKESANGFFDGMIMNKEFEGHEFKVVNKKTMVVFYCDGEICGYGLTLSTAGQLKSKEFPFVKNLIFDEFIIERGVYRYLQFEVHSFLDILETIFRTRDFRCFMLGNAVNRINPYFNYFKIEMPYNTDIKTYKDGEILIQYIKNEEYRNFKKQTRFGKLIDGTEYGKYAIDNQFLHESRIFVGKRPATAKFYFTLKVGEEDYGIWSDYRSSKVFISKDYDPCCPIVFTIDPDSHDETTRLVSMRRSDFFKSLIDHYRTGLLYFDSMKTKAIILPILNKYAV